MRINLRYSQNKSYADTRGVNVLHFALQLSSTFTSHNFVYKRFYCSQTKEMVRFLLQNGIDKIGATKTEQYFDDNLRNHSKKDSYVSAIISQIYLFCYMDTGVVMMFVREQREQFRTTMQWTLYVLDEFQGLWLAVKMKRDSADSKEGTFMHPLEEWFLTTINLICDFCDRWVTSKHSRNETHLEVICNGLVLSTAILQKLMTFPAISFRESDVTQHRALFGSLLQIMCKILSLFNKQDHVKQIRHPKEYEAHIGTFISLIHGIIYMYLSTPGIIAYE